MTRCRELLRDDGAASYKTYRTENLPHFGTHAIFKTRRAGLPDAERFEGFSGLLQVDFDNVPADELEPLREKARACPHVVAGFVSPSGAGFKVLLAVAVAKSREEFLAIAKAGGRFAAAHFGREPDSGVLTDAARLCAVSWDANAFHNPGATPLPWAGVPTGERHNTIKGIVASLVSRGIREDAEIIARVRAIVPDAEKPDAEIISVADWARGREVSKEEFAAGLEAEALSKFFYLGRAGYAMRNGNGFLPLPSEGLVKSHLAEMGVAKDRREQVLCGIRTKNFVLHCGPLAGFHAGLHYSPEADGKILVTSGPRIVKAEPGSWPFLGKFFREFADDPEHPEQMPALLAWIRQARRNLLRGKRRPLPALILVGPRRAGKSFLISLIQQALGGRAANGYNSLAGLTAFNGDTIGAELLTCDDQTASRDARTRGQLAQGLKEKLFAGAVRIEAKGRDAVNLRPIQAVVMAANDEPEHLATLPVLDDSLADKLTIVKGRRASFEGLGQDAIEDKVAEELPALLYYLETTDHPENLKDPRTGAAAWQHPDIREALCEIAPETRLLELLATSPAILASWQAGEPWEGTGQELRSTLEGDLRTRDAARGLLIYPNTAGIYLARLAYRFPARFECRKVHGLSRWRILPPGGGGEAGSDLSRGEGARGLGGGGEAIMRVSNK